MIVDVTGIVLMPGNGGNDCSGNGSFAEIECCCDECDYMQCCIDAADPEACKTCTDKNCPRVGKVTHAGIDEINESAPPLGGA